MKKGLKFAGLAILSVLARTGCTKGGDSTSTAGSDKPASTLKVGLICVGDETETYSKAHIDGIKAAAAKLGATVIYKNSVPEGTQVVDACTELKEAGAQLIFTNSYGHQDYACAFAKIIRILPLSLILAIMLLSLDFPISRMLSPTSMKRVMSPVLLLEGN